MRRRFNTEGQLRGVKSWSQPLAVRSGRSMYDRAWKSSGLVHSFGLAVHDFSFSARRSQPQSCTRSPIASSNRLSVAGLQLLVQAKCPLGVCLVQRKAELPWTIFDHVFGRKTVRDAHVLSNVAAIGRVGRPSPVGTLTVFSRLFGHNLGVPSFCLQREDGKGELHTPTDAVVVVFSAPYFARKATNGMSSPIIFGLDVRRRLSRTVFCVWNSAVTSRTFR